MKKERCTFQIQQHHERLAKALQVAAGLAEMPDGRETLDTALLLAAECAGDYAGALERHGADDAADGVAVLRDSIYSESYSMHDGNAPDPESIRRALRITQRITLQSAA